MLWLLLLAQDFGRPEAVEALRRATAGFRERAGVRGGYVWRVSADGARREGEGKASALTAWVQPPGTPSVGEVFLRAHAATGEAVYLDAVRETSGALVEGQLRSGGWTYRIEFDPAERRKYAFRAGGGEKGRNVSTLDDDTTQAALRFLMRADRALGFKDGRIHEAATYALESLVKAQHANGAWSQGFEGPSDPAAHAPRPAGYPEGEPTRRKDYWVQYTFNDNLARDLIETLWEASEIYGEARWRAAAEKTGEFILRAQLPEPQPAWAQQYDFEMHPAWARKFEPASVTGGESQGLLQTLLVLYRRTGDKKWLEPVPRALEYLKRSRLLDGKLARFYELRTNKPLYFTKEYALVYTDDDLPTHYGFKVPSKLEKIERDYQKLLKEGPPKPRPARPETVGPEEARAAAKALDERGCWIKDGWIESDTFIENAGALCRFLESPE